MTSIYNKIKERLRLEFQNDPKYDQIFIAVWDKIIYMLTINGTLIKVKGEINVPPKLILNTIRAGIMVFKNPSNSGAKMEFIDTFNLMNYYILDDYNLRDMRKEPNDQEE